MGVDVAPVKLKRTFRPLTPVPVPSFASLLYLPYSFVKSEFEHESESFCKNVASNLDALDLAVFFDFDNLLMRFGVENESFDSENWSSFSKNVEFSDSVSILIGIVELRPLDDFFDFFSFCTFGVEVVNVDVVAVDRLLPSPPQSTFSLRYLMVIFCNLSEPFLRTMVDASICSSISSA